MKKLLIIVLLTLKLFSQEKELKIASFNVENLFDLKADKYEYKIYKPNSASNWNKNTFKKKLTNLSRVIRDIDADILALQEVESLLSLKALQKQLKKGGLNYPYLALATQKNTTVKVALLSKVAFEMQSELFVTHSYRYRNILEVHLHFHTQKLYLFVNHWKSKRGKESRRVVSAKVLRKRIEALGEGKNIIILGDLNSGYEEKKEFLHTRLNDTNGITGINHILKTQKIVQNARDAQKHLIKGELYNLWYDLEPHKRYSYIYKNKKKTMDHIIISPSLLKQNARVHYVLNSFRTLHKPYLFKNNRLYRWQIKRKKHLGKGFSDHLALSAVFTFK